jgi:ABC-2 type transport system permease protein
MNIYLYELKAHRRFAITWIVTLLLLVFILCSFFPIFNKDMATFLDIIRNMPEGIRKSFGMNPDTIGSILGYYAFTLTFIYICSGIEAMILGLSILSKEIRERTADFLLSKPVSRESILASKVLSSLTLIIITNIICFIGFYFSLLMFTNTHFSFKTYALLTFTIFFIQIIFLCIGLLLSVIIPKVKAILSISLGTVCGVYLLSTFTDETLRVLMPFKYFDIAQILLKANYDIKYIIVSLLIVLISVYLTCVVYKRRDIDAV